MDSILYIVVGLVITLLIVVLIKRKNKAQQPSATVNKKPTATRVRANSAIDRPNTNQSNPAGASGVTKFDNITVAQRFIDQQRYDKAIETLQRGLAEKPYDCALLLKLLNVYTITNQHDDFQQAYNIIQSHGDQETIAQAQQLKGLISEQHPILTTTEDVSLVDRGLVSKSSTTDDKVSAITLVAVDTSVDDDLAFYFDISQPSVDDVNDIENELGLSSEFDFSTESATIDAEANSTFDANSFDIDDLNSEVPSTSSQKDSQQQDNDEFFLDLEDNDTFNIVTNDADATNVYASSLLDNESENALVNSVAETVSQPDADDEATFDFDIADSNVVTEDTVVTSTSPTFDDHTLIDDDFIFDTDTDVTSFVPVITEPVVVESDITSYDINNGTAVDFDPQFAKDFDFVKTLDSNQVTLDLAGQYLRLGEYDSARRLLEEVIAQGNSKQQQQAQALLSRTA